MKRCRCGEIGRHNGLKNRWIKSVGVRAPSPVPYSGVEQLVACRVHGPKVAGSSPAPATSTECCVDVNVGVCMWAAKRPSAVRVAAERTACSAELIKLKFGCLKAVGMYEYREHSPSQLSGGQKQRIAIAGVIAMRPECIVLDEPTAMLDPAGRREVMKTIRRLNRDSGVTIVLITHYMDEAAKADRVIVMEKGGVILDDTPENVFSNVELLRKVGLDVPQSTQLMYAMKNDGFDTADTHIINEEACAEYLYELLKG